MFKTSQAGTVFLLLAFGVWYLFSGLRFMWVGWVSILLGVGIVFYYSRVFLNPTTLRDLLIMLVGTFGGLKLLMWRGAEGF